MEVRQQLRRLSDNNREFSSRVINLLDADVRLSQAAAMAENKACGAEAIVVVEKFAGPEYRIMRFIDVIALDEGVLFIAGAQRGEQQFSCA